MSLFINYQKAFECVDWINVLEMLRNTGVNWKEHQLIGNLHMRLNQGENDSVKIGRAVRLGLNSVRPEIHW